MQRGDQHSARQPNAFIDIIILGFAVFFNPALTLGEHHDQPWCGFQEWFLLVSSKRIESAKPFVAGFGFARVCSVEFALLVLSGSSDGFLDVRRGDHSKVPWLMIGTVRRAAACQNSGFNDFLGDSCVGEVPA